MQTRPSGFERVTRKPGCYAALAVGVFLGLLALMFGGGLLISYLRSSRSAPTPTLTPAPKHADDVQISGELVPVPPVTVAPLTFAVPEQASNLYLEYILDASGSMMGRLSDGTLKRDVAREVLVAHIRSFPSETHIGLRAYGHSVPWQGQEEESCRDIELIAPMETGQLERIAGWLEDMQAQGMTPLAAAIEQAIADFEVAPGRVNTLVMISDGEETCGGDPCAAVQALKAQGINFTLHVVGLDVAGAARRQLQCIAEAGGGLYRDADSAITLDEALGDISEEVAASEAAPAPVATDTMPPPTPTATQAPVVEPTPTATPEPTDTPTPTLTPTPCLPDGELISDVTIPDNTEVAPGDTFTKIWRMRSSGCAAWPANTELVFVSGERLGAPGSVGVPAAAPGADVDISVDMRAPDAPGTYRSNWQLRGPDGAFFGDRIYVQIVVPEPMSVTFVADRYTVKRGQCATLSWQVSNASSVLYNGRGVDPQGSAVECPTTTTTYELIAQDSLGNQQRHTLTITVDTGY